MPLPRAKQLWPLLTRGDLSLDASISDAPTPAERMSYKQPTPEETVAEEMGMGVIETDVFTTLLGLGIAGAALLALCVAGVRNNDFSAESDQ